MNRLLTLLRATRPAAVVVVALGIAAALPMAAHAQRGGRKPSAAQRAAMKKAQQQMQAYQRDVERYQKEMAEKHAEIFARYDENGDGRLLGKERSLYDKYMFDVQKGREPNPFAGIALPGQGKDMPATSK